jgi:hypothetical protein
MRKLASAINNATTSEVMRTLVAVSVADMLI